MKFKKSTLTLFCATCICVTLCSCGKSDEKTTQTTTAPTTSVVTTTVATVPVATDETITAPTQTTLETTTTPTPTTTVTTPKATTTTTKVTTTVTTTTTTTTTKKTDPYEKYLGVYVDESDHNYITNNDGSKTPYMSALDVFVYKGQLYYQGGYKILINEKDNTYRVGEGGGAENKLIQIDDTHFWEKTWDDDSDNEHSNSQVVIDYENGRFYYCYYNESTKKFEQSSEYFSIRPYTGDSDEVRSWSR